MTATDKTKVAEWQYGIGTGKYTLLYENGWLHISIEVYRRSKEGDERLGLAWGFRTAGAITTHRSLDLPSGLPQNRPRKRQRPKRLSCSS